MRKTVIIVISVILIILLAVMMLLGISRADMSFANDATVNFVYEGSVIHNKLDDDDLKTVKQMFDGKVLYKESYSCGFSEDISIVFNSNQTFCIACDTCPIIYWKEKNRYFSLSEEEKNILYSILKNHGFYFPCI